MSTRKLSKQQVEEIRDRYVSMNSLAKEYGVSRQRVAQLLKGRSRFKSAFSYVVDFFNTYPEKKVTLKEVHQAVCKASGREIAEGTIRHYLDWMISYGLNAEKRVTLYSIQERNCPFDPPKPRNGGKKNTTPIRRRMRRSKKYSGK